ncbi:MAG: class I tRNA ligase family protein, partial [Candidatus Bipolaricaulota bacterium]|nr:class I tRNA ligase family protein [Candidatus Bipolaricaulota bacterium]
EYDPVAATQAIATFVDEVSNWYVRNSRPRFWGNAWTTDKKAAFMTLYEVLLALAKLLAPFVPFLAEAIYQNLKTEQMPESVHLCDWPSAEEQLRDLRLEAQMQQTRQIVSAGLQARNKAQIKVRQPLALAAVLTHNAPLDFEYRQLICQELNVKKLEWLSQDQPFALYTPKFEYEKAALGRDLRGLAPKAMQILEELNRAHHERRVQVAQEL